MAKCPNCGQTVNSTALVDAFNDPANWQFWGDQGQRWIVCRGAAYVHFRVNVNGRQQHRLAIVRGAAEDWLSVQERAFQVNKDKGLMK